MNILRIGLGFDSHPMVAGRPCRLGAINFDHPSGPQGHSDGDVILHALMDALLGAAGLDDLGSLFPNTDPKYKDADSSEMCKRVFALVYGTGYECISADVVLIADGPKIGPLRDKMRKKLAGLLGTDIAAVNVKAKTTEGLSLVQGGTAIAAQAVCLLQRRNQGR